MSRDPVTPQTVRQIEVREDLLRGFLNAHAVFRVIACLFIASMFVQGGWPGRYFLDAPICIGTITLSGLYTWVRRTHWTHIARTINLGWGDVPIPIWPRRTRWRYTLFPIGPLLVDLGAIGLLAAHTGGASSGFVFLFPILAATADFVLYSDRRHNTFLMAILAVFATSSAAAWFEWIEQYKLMEIVPLHSDVVNGRLYWLVTSVQFVFMALLGHVMHVNGKAYIDARTRGY